MARYRWASAAAGWVVLLGVAAAPAENADHSKLPRPGAIAFSSLAPRGWDVYLVDGQTNHGTPTWGPPLDMDPHQATAAEEASEY